MGLSYLKMALASAVIAGGLMTGAALAQDVTVGLITKTETNPFFVKMREGAEAKAAELGVPIVFAAVDPSGNPILLHRMADSLLGSIDIAMNKAWSANAFKQSTASLGRAAATVLPGLADGNKGRVVLFGGGEPVFVDGRLLGGLGISGGTVEEDCQILNFAMEQVLGDM